MVSMIILDKKKILYSPFKTLSKKIINNMGHSYS
jgi:hypothetical protein